MSIFKIIEISLGFAILIAVIAVLALRTREIILEIKELAESKGYDGNAWVREYFFSAYLSREQVILELVSLPDRNRNNDTSPEPYIPDDENAWQCGYGIFNPEYTGTCSCGRTKNNPNANTD